jgi:hypothetical protein
MFMSVAERSLKLRTLASVQSPLPELLVAIVVGPNFAEKSSCSFDQRDIL